MAKKDEDQPKTVTLTNSDGADFEAEVGVDGENPVSVNNPPAKSVDPAFITDDNELERPEPEGGVDNSPNEPSTPAQAHSKESTGSGQKQGQSQTK